MPGLPASFKIWKVSPGSTSTGRPLMANNINCRPGDAAAMLALWVCRRAYDMNVSYPAVGPDDDAHRISISRHPHRRSPARPAVITRG